VAEYRPNRVGTGQWLRSSSELRSAVTSVAEQIATRARMLAPVETGEYLRSITVRQTRAENGRVAADVEANAPHSAIVELRDHVLRRAAEGL
jgi:phage gp46-like protein